MPSYKASEPTSRPDYVEAGDYTVEVLNAEESVSKQGNELIELKLKVEPSGAILYDNLVFTPNAFWKIDAFRAATGESVTPDEEIEILADELIGRTGRARLSVEEYNGRKRNKVAAWLPQETTQEGGKSNGNNPF
jgi:hypothetical protein